MLLKRMQLLRTSKNFVASAMQAAALWSFALGKELLGSPTHASR